MLICIYIIFFFALLFFFVKYLSIWIIKIKAKKYSIKINSKEAKELLKQGCVSSAFFSLCSLFIDNCFDFDIVQLGYHYISGGNLQAVLSGFIYVRDNQLSASSADIYAIDLAKKDVIETLKRGKPYF